MKWINNSIVSLVLFAFCFTRAKAATQEVLATVFFRFYNGSSIEEYFDVHLDEAENLVSDLKLHKPTVIYFHGYTESVNFSRSIHTIVNAYLHRNDHNVIAVDWSEIAGQDYMSVVADVDTVAGAIALAIDDMVLAGLPAEKLHLVSHSMGSQLAAYVARKLHFTVPRITGLDPAGPFFNILQNRLANADARFVDIIHTDYGFYGIGRPTGTVDFFPNRGRRVQPGCPLFFAWMSKEDFCSHHRSWTFYAESLINEQSFLAVPCSRGHRSSARKRLVSDMIVMGYATPTNAKGSYCLVTNATEPYGRGFEGAYEA